jgi:hypothetical protein
MIIKIFLFFYKIHYILILHQEAVVVMLVRSETGLNIFISLSEWFQGQ